MNWPLGHHPQLLRQPLPTLPSHHFFSRKDKSGEAVAQSSFSFCARKPSISPGPKDLSVSVEKELKNGSITEDQNPKAGGTWR